MSGEQQEPSMEEILASIRRIISEDPQPAEAAPPPADPLADFEPTPAAAAAPPPVEEDPFASFEPTPVFTPEPAPQPEPVVDDVFDLTPAMRLEPEPEPEPEIIPQPYYRAPEPEPAPALQPEEEDRLMSAATEAAAASALAGLVVPKIMSSTGLEGLTVESIVRELLRPMLREWMDNNLPTLVERLVEAEIERLSRRPRL